MNTYRKVLVTSSVMLALMSMHIYAGKHNILKYNSLRIAYYCDGERLAQGYADGYMVRVKKANYNYIQAEFKINKYDSESGITSKKTHFKNAFLRADKYGLRLIPLIQMGSKWSLSWSKINNDAIEMNIYQGKKRRWGCPSFAYDSLGIDKSFMTVLRIIKQAHRDAKLSYDLEFIHLGHDEPVDNGYLLIGGVPDHLAGLKDQYSKKDRDYILDRINNHKDDLSTAFQTLIINQLYRRINQVHKIFGNKTKVIIYGDLWDPQANGGLKKEVFITKDKEICYDLKGDVVNCKSQQVKKRIVKPQRGLFVTMCPGIGFLPGLNNQEKEVFRKNIILQPWCYYDSWPHGGDPDGDGDYNTEKTFAYFTERGLMFNYVSVYKSKANNKKRTQIEYRAMKEYSITSKKFQNKCVGFTVAPWSASWKSPPNTPKSMDTLEELYNLNKNNIPENSFK